MPIEAIGLYGKGTEDMRYTFARARDSTTGNFKSLHGTVTVSIYEPDSKGARNAVYALVIVVEERMQNRWVGAPLKFCHVASHELGFAVGAPIGGRRSTALLLATRDCHVHAHQPASLPSRDELWALLRAATGQPKAPLHDPAELTSRELLKKSPLGPYF